MKLLFPSSVRSNPVSSLRCTSPRGPGDLCEQSFVRNQKKDIGRGRKVLRELVKIHCVNNNKKRKEKTIFVGLQTISYSDFSSPSPLTQNRVRGRLSTKKKKNEGANYCYIVETDLRDQRFNWLSNFHPWGGLFVVHYCIHILCCGLRKPSSNVTALRRVFKNQRYSNMFMYIKTLLQSKTISKITRMNGRTNEKKKKCLCIIQYCVVSLINNDDCDL